MTIQAYREICDWLRRAIDGTPWQGHVFAVGGCCRDAILGREINDIDLAVDVPNGGIRLAQWFRENDMTVTEPTIFERYGTAMFHLEAFPELEIEAVQTRCGKYTNDIIESPESVFGSLADDARRRDFIINTLYCDITADRVLDPTGMALDDIHDHRLRTPMDPAMTFFDDPVRILRGIRMACVLGWNIEQSLLEVMRNNLSGLSEIKIERRRAEFEKMLVSANPVRALNLMRSVNAMRFLLPEMETTYRTCITSRYDTVWRRACRAIRALAESDIPMEEPAEQDRLALAYAALFHNLHLIVPSRKGIDFTPEEAAIISARHADTLLRKLKYHTRFIREVTFLIRNQHVIRRWGDRAQALKERQLRRFANLCVTKHRAYKLLTFIHAVNQTGPAELQRPAQVPCVINRMQAAV